MHHERDFGSILPMENLKYTYELLQGSHSALRLDYSAAYIYMTGSSLRRVDLYCQ